ncbi:MAG: hypothetical protein EOP50_12855 [Sphingobacteriales bacterium]|nr:MAG: hypothetical protein EOP50_12855 [Sphingobacteriales bacterium]
MIQPTQQFSTLSSVQAQPANEAFGPLYQWTAHAQAIRAELQENMAQSLAAAKLYLDMAERDGDRVLLAKAKDLVDQVIYEMIRLTRQLPPAEASLALAV